MVMNVTQTNAEMEFSNVSSFHIPSQPSEF